MGTLALSGWAQPTNALESVVPKDTVHFNYSAFNTVESCFSALADQLSALHSIEQVVGWSLGGQIAVRAIAAGVLTPKKLVLLATPYQCCASASFPFATSPTLLEESRLAFLANSELMLKQFQSLMALGYANPLRFMRQFSMPSGNTQKNHLFWFDELVRFSCDILDFSAFPPTIIVHGELDAVVPVMQSEMFASRIPQNRLYRFPACGHAPHWYDEAKIRSFIQSGDA